MLIFAIVLVFYFVTHSRRDVNMPACSTKPLATTMNIANLTTLHLSVKQEDMLKMPEYSGSMLRGAFGVALRELTCITAMSECKQCPIKERCKFPRIFETPALLSTATQAVNPYVIHVPTTTQQLCGQSPLIYKRGDIWHFSMTLMGAATLEFGIIIKAWKRALKTGLGTHQPYKRATLLQVSCDDKIIYCEAYSSTDINTHLIQNIPYHISIHSIPEVNSNFPIHLIMRFLTPFRYQHHNRIVSQPDQLDSYGFVASLYNRIRLCQENHSANENWDIGYDSYYLFRDDISTLGIEAEVSAHHVPRRSNRQQRKMQLYGLQGDIHLTGESKILQRLLPALQLGERLHIGKNTTMGLGQYQLVFDNAEASVER